MITVTCSSDRCGVGVTELDAWCPGVRDCDALMVRRRLLVPVVLLLGGFGGAYLSVEEGWSTRFISSLPSPDQRSTVTKKKEQSTSLVLKLQKPVDDGEGGDRYILDVDKLLVFSAYYHLRHSRGSQRSPILSLAWVKQVALGRMDAIPLLYRRNHTFGLAKDAVRLLMRSV